MYKKLNNIVLLAISLGLVCASTVQAGPAEDQYAVGAGHYSQGRWKLAAHELGIFLDKYHDHPRAISASFFLGEALVQLGEHAKAREYFLKYVGRAPGHRYEKQALFRIGEASFLAGKHDRAQKDLKRFIARFPGDPLAAYALPYLGEILLGFGNSRAAKEKFSEACSRYPTGPLAQESRFGLARSHIALGERIQAEKIFAEIARQSKASLADDSQLQLGMSQYNRKDYPGADSSLKKFESDFRDSVLVPEARYWRGMALIVLNRWEEAASVLNQAMIDAPEHRLVANMAYYSAEALQRAGKLAEAESKYEFVLENRPDSKIARKSLQGRIQTALRQDNHTQVISLTQKFTRLYPSSPQRFDVQQLLGRSYLKSENFEAAEKVFEQLIREIRNPNPLTRDMKPGELQQLLNSVNYLHALALLGEEEHQTALDMLEKINLENDRSQIHAGINAARAFALVGLDRHEDAILPLKSYLAAQPDGPDANKCHAELTVSLTHVGRLDEAKKAYETYKDKFPHHDLLLPTTYFLAEKSYSNGKKQWARELFTFLAQEENPEEYRAKGLSGLAWSQLHIEGIAQSAATFERLIRDHPDSPLAAEAAFARGNALEKLGQDDPALAMYHLVIDKYPTTEQMQEALQAAARLHVRLKQNRDALGLLNRLIEDFPKAAELDAVHYQKAWVLYDLGRIQDSQSSFTKVYEDYPKSRFWADATYRLADHASKEKNDVLTRRLTTEIIESNPQGTVLAHALYLRGLASTHSGQWDDVSPWLQRLIAEFPESSLRIQSEYWIAEASYRLGNYDQAEKQFSELSRKLPGRTESWLAMVPLRESQVLAQKQKWQDALEKARSISKNYPNFSRKYEVDYLIGRALASQAKFEDARVSYQRVIDSEIGGKTETAAMAQWMIGESYFHQKDYDEAIRAYSRVELLYDYPRWQAGSLLQTGKCYEMKNQWKEAVDRYAQLLKLYSKTIFQEEASRRLRVASQRAAMTVIP